MATGYLKVTSTTANGVSPVSAAMVNLTQSEDCSTVFDYTFTTNADGLGEVVALDAPERALSLSVTNTEQPYSTYDLYVTADGYEPVTVSGIQIFADVTTLMNVKMVSTSDGVTYDNSINNIVIEPHTLFAKNGGSGQTPLSISSIPRVLSEPVIPTSIVVHLGIPNQNASNVRVSFRDYIKNVASFEVYPSWPEEALLANIYAQMSVALNRVYTEWYISRGFSFQITNSPSYDQKYVHNASVFENVARLVDRVFNSYIRNNGNVEPYFASYCDGEIVSCDGMKQWGSKDLAEDGYSALQILRYYYGNGVAIYENNNIEDVEESYPGTPLKVGSTGEDVKTIQRQLDRIADDFPFFGSLTADGVFGTGTETVVKRFQDQFGLVDDGIVGSATWYSISYIYVSVKKLAQLTSEGEKPTGEPPTGGYDGEILKLGSSGSKVAQLQMYLNYIGQYNTVIPTLTEDGQFGPATEAAVRAYQEYYSLEVDGIVGEMTWNSIEELYENLNIDTLPPEQLGPNVYPGTLIKVGSVGDNVRRVQFWLTIISYNFTDIPSVTADGIFGTATEAAVIDFQNYFGLSISDGIVGKETWDKMFEAYAATDNYLLEPDQRPGTFEGISLRQGSKGQQVKEAQFYLFILSAYYSEIEPIEYDGLFGALTTAAVREFQRLFDLNDDGVIGRLTWNELYEQYTTLRAEDGNVRAYYLAEYPGFDLLEGSDGSWVSLVQYWLNYISLYVDSIVPPTTNGVYDLVTTEAVKDFQRVVGIDVTGVVDAETWAAFIYSYSSLISVYQKAKFESGEYTCPYDYPGYVLTLGSLGPAVLALQQRMDKIASRYGTPFFVPMDSIYGESTFKAVKQFQEQLGIKMTGIVTKDTWDEIFALPV